MNGVTVVSFCDYVVKDIPFGFVKRINSRLYIGSHSGIVLLFNTIDDIGHPIDVLPLYGVVIHPGRKGALSQRDNIELEQVRELTNP